MRRVRNTSRIAEYPIDDHTPVVTGVTPDPRVPGLVIVELDGSRFGAIPAEAVAADAIAEGVAIEPPVFRRLAQAADIAAAHRVALRILAARPRSVFEMRRALRDRGHGVAAIDRAVDRLLDNGLLDDEEFARHFVRVRCAKGHGPARLRADLLARGIDGRLAERAVGDVLADEEVDLEVQARRLAEKRLAQLRGLPPATQRRRLHAFLNRRGYAGWMVREMVDQLVNET